MTGTSPSITNPSCSKLGEYQVLLLCVELLVDAARLLMPVHDRLSTTLDARPNLPPYQLFSLHQPFASEKFHCCTLLSTRYPREMWLYANPPPLPTAWNPISNRVAIAIRH